MSDAASSPAATPAPRFTVGFLPWWPANPYQLLLKRELNARGVRVIGSPPLSPLRILLKRDGLDVVHVHWPHGTYKTWPGMLYMALVLCLYRLRRNNIIWTAHELTAYESRHPRRDAWFQRLVQRLARGLIVHGQHTRRIVQQERGYARDVTVAMHPSFAGWYKDELSRDEARRRLQLGPERRAFLYFGYIKPYKGVEDLIAAFRTLPGEHLSLHIVGRPLDDAIKAQVESLAAADARISTRLAYIPDDDVQLYFRAADVVVFPFRETQTSGSMMLALTFGCPIVAPDIATLSEYVDARMGVLYDPAQPDALRQALARAAEAPLHAMAQASQQRGVELNWPAMAEAHLQAYRAALPAGAAP